MGTDLAGYLRVVGLARRQGHLTVDECQALRDFAAWLFQPVTDEAAIAAGFRRGLDELASSTTPSRARRLALWSPFDPVALERAAAGTQPHGRSA